MSIIFYTTKIELRFGIRLDKLTMIFPIKGSYFYTSNQFNWEATITVLIRKHLRNCTRNPHREQNGRLLNELNPGKMLQFYSFVTHTHTPRLDRWDNKILRKSLPWHLRRGSPWARKAGNARSSSRMAIKTLDRTKLVMDSTRLSKYRNKKGGNRKARERWEVISS